VRVSLAWSSNSASSARGLLPASEAAALVEDLE
jgi:hypothetical protein